MAEELLIPKLAKAVEMEFGHILAVEANRKEQMMSSAKIWCEVFCDHCGGVVGRYFKNIDTISWLKKETSDWVVVKHGLQLCPSCYTKFIGADNETD